MKYFERNRDYLFELAEDYTVQVPITVAAWTPFVNVVGGVFTAKNHYAFDGSSIPLKGFFKAITFGLYDADRYCKEAAVTHDGFYQLMRLKKLDRKHKDTIDRLYEKMCIEGATKIILALKAEAVEKIMASGFSDLKKGGKLIKLDKKTDRKLARLPAWAARRYWAVKHFGGRTLKPRYRPEKVILET